MRIYIDEAGLFVVPNTGADSYSLVLALVIPSANEAELFNDFLQLRDDWPVKGIEIKGSSLNEAQTAQVIEVCKRYDVLVEFCALNMATHDNLLSEDFKKRQADEVIAHITPQHQPTLVQSLQQMSDKILKMPNQLFLQAFATLRMLLKTVEEATLYYAQRMPEELGDIAWIIDRKDHTLTQMEEMWSTLILPISESHFARNPFGQMKEADYSHFNKRYTFTKGNADSEMVRHSEWVRETYGLQPFDEDDIAGNAGRLFCEQRDFKDSLDSLGLQLADILATTLRRALNGNLQTNGWKEFGRLIVRRKNIGSYFVQLGVGVAGPINMPKHAAAVCRVLDRKAKAMLLPD
jgi:hypothetical protein